MPRTCLILRVNGVEHYFTSCQGDEYLCHPQHRQKGFSSKKSQWRVTRPKECHICCQARVLENSYPQNLKVAGGVWYVAPGGASVGGAADERLAFFEAGDQSGKPWHGYPVGSSSHSKNSRRPPSELILHWSDTKRIPSHVADKLMRRVL